MENTYLNFRTLASLHTGEQDLSKLAEEYQRTESPIILAYEYCSMYFLIRSQVSKYFNLTSQDLASFSVEELHKALLKYDSSKSTKIETMYTTYLNRRLYAETSMLNHQVRSANYISDSYEELCVTATDYRTGEEIEPNGRAEDEEGYGEVELYETLKNLELSDREMNCCKIVMEETHKLKNTELGDILGITSAGVAYLKKGLGKKLSIDLNY